MNKLINFIKDTKAIASIETAILLLPFIIFMAVIIESAVLAYQIMLIDNSIDHAAKYASSFKGEVKKHFDEYIKSKEDNLLSFAKNIKTNVEFCDDIKTLAGQKCPNAENEKSKIAVFKFEYEIKPIFLITRTKIDKELIASKAVGYIE